MKLVLSGQVSENTVRAFSVDVRNRFEATLYVDNAASWKIINANYQIMPPMNKEAKKVYNSIVDALPEGGEVVLGELMQKLALPPYGMNEYASLYMLMTVFANMSYCLRALYKDVLYSISSWKDIVVGDQKIDLNAISKTIVKRINAGAVADQFTSLFNRINSNQDTDLVESLEKELNLLTKAEQIPDQLAAQSQLAKMKLQEGRRLIRNWNNQYENTMKLYDKLLEKTDIYSGLQCLQELTSYQFFRVFTETSYTMSEAQQIQLKNQAEMVRAKIEPFLAGYITQQRCTTVESMGGYKSFMKKLRGLLEEQGYAKYAVLCGEVAEKELSSKEVIKERQEIRSNYNSFIRDNIPDESTPYTTLLSWREQATKLLGNIEKHADSIGSDADNMRSTIQNHLKSLNKKIDDIKKKMNKIYDDLDSVANLHDIQQLISDIDRLKFLGIPESDMKDFLEIKQMLSTFVEDVAVMMEEQYNRQRFQDNFEVLYKKYVEKELEFDVVSILEGLGTTIRDELNNKDAVWSKKHLSVPLQTVPEIHAWLQDTERLPTYLSDETRNRYAEKKKEVDMILSKARVDDIIQSFNNLSAEEKTRCFAALKEMV